MAPSYKNLCSAECPIKLSSRDLLASQAALCVCVRYFSASGARAESGYGLGNCLLDQPSPPSLLLPPPPPQQQQQQGDEGAHLESMSCPPSSDRVPAPAPPYASHRLAYAKKKNSVYQHNDASVLFASRQAKTG